MNLVVNFYSFSGFKKISMSITWSYEFFNVLFVIRTKKDSEKFTKCYKGEPSKGISNTENRFPLRPPPPNAPPGFCPGPTRGPKRPRSPLTQFESPQHTKVWIRPCMAFVWNHKTENYSPLKVLFFYLRRTPVSLTDSSIDWTTLDIQATTFRYDWLSVPI